MSDLSLVQDDAQPSELDIAKAEVLRLSNLLSITRHQLSNVMFQCAERDLEIAELRSKTESPA